MRNALAFAFVVLTQVACAAIYSGEPSINGHMSDQWRECAMWDRC